MRFPYINIDFWCNNLSMVFDDDYEYYDLNSLTEELYSADFNLEELAYVMFHLQKWARVCDYDVFK